MADAVMVSPCFCVVSSGKDYGGHEAHGTRFHGSALFCRGLFDNLLPYARTCFPWENINHPLWHMTFTAIPPAVTDFNYHKESAEFMCALPGTICDMVVEILDERKMGGGELMMRL
jgi:hypothetical protein